MAKLTLELETDLDDDMMEGVVYGHRALKVNEALEDWLKEQLEPKSERTKSEHVCFSEVLKRLHELNKGERDGT